MKKLLSVMLACLVISPALSSADTASGPITWPYRIFVSGSQSFHYRIFKEGNPISFCSGIHSNEFAYINEADDGAKGKIAALLTAYALQRDIHIQYSVTDADGYCQIRQFTM